MAEMPQEEKSAFMSVEVRRPKTQVGCQQGIGRAMGNAKEIPQASIHLDVKHMIVSVNETGRVQELEVDNLMDAPDDRLWSKMRMATTTTKQGEQRASEFADSLWVEGDGGAVVLPRIRSRVHHEAKVFLRQDPW